MKLLTLPPMVIVLRFRKHQVLPNTFMRRNCHIRTSPRISAYGFAVLAVALACGSIGCRKDPAEVPPPPASTQAVATATQAAAPTAPNLDEITRQLRRWILKNQRPPKNFEDFASTTSYQIPPPPPGKKYVINRQMHVVLENR